MYSTVSGPIHPPLAFGYCRKSTTGQREESIEAQQRAVIREMVHKIIVFDDGPGGFRVRIILNPGHVAPANIPENVETASLSELQDFSTNGGRGLPLPPMHEIVILPFGLIVAEFMVSRK